MFGHDDQNQSDDTGVTPAMSPAPDDLVNVNHSGGPSFDTSAVSLDQPASSVPAANDDSTAPVATAPVHDNDDHLLTTDGDDDLINIKQSALQQLSPLVGHLDQSPEEKFRTTMMMIQASDDQSLIKTAYEAAQQISDEKVRAQALLDIVNEINYFTQQSNS